MAIPNQFLRIRSAQPYLTAETTPGAFVAPAGSDAFVTVDPLVLSQTINYTDINEVGSRLLQTRSLQNYAERATFDFNFLLKPSGSAGTAPAESFLLQRIFGTETTTSSTSVAYTFSRVSGTFQACQIVDNWMLACAQGTVITGANIDINREGALQMTANAQSSRIYYAGPVEGSGSDVTVDDQGASVTLSVASNTTAADYVFNGMQVDAFSSDNTQLNTGAVTVSNASTSAGTCTLTASTGDSFSFGDTDYLRPYVPAPSLPSYEAIGQGAAQIYLAAQNTANGTGSGQMFHSDNAFLGKTFSASISKNLGDPGLTELTGDLYGAPTYVSQNFEVTGSFAFVVRPDQVYRFRQFTRAQQVAIGVQVGSESGRIIRFYMPSVRVNISLAEDEGAVGGTVEFTLTQGTSATDAAAFQMIYL